MRTKVVALSFIAAILSASRADAKIATKLFSTGSHVEVSASYEPINSSVQICGGLFGEFAYQQRMSFEEAGSDLVFAESVYSAGRKDLILVAECDGYFIYDVGSCSC